VVRGLQPNVSSGGDTGCVMSWKSWITRCPNNTRRKPVVVMEMKCLVNAVCSLADFSVLMLHQNCALVVCASHPYIYISRLGIFKRCYVFFSVSQRGEALFASLHRGSLCCLSCSTSVHIQMLICVNPVATFSASGSKWTYTEFYSVQAFDMLSLYYFQLNIVFEIFGVSVLITANH